MNQQTRSLESVETELSRTILYVALLVFALACVGYALIFNFHREQQKASANAALESALKIYTTNLLSQVAIVASTSEFIGYIRSGTMSRTQLFYEYTEAMSHMPKEVVGWELKSRTHKNSIDKRGAVSQNVITLSLCYLNSTLDQKYGLCIADLTLYLSDTTLFNKLHLIDNNIYQCVDCKPVTELPDVSNPFFKVTSSLVFIGATGMADFDWALGASIFLSLVIIILVSAWFQKRAKSIIRQEIVSPIMGILDGHVTSIDSSKNSSIQQILEIAYQKKLLLAKTYAEEAQKRRLANEIHDLIGALLIQIKWDITQLTTEAAKPKIAQRALTKLDQLVSITENFIESLRPELLDTLGLKKALIALVDEWAEKNDACEYASYISLDSTQIPEAVSNAIYRIAQESLANIYKHAKARHATLRISSTIHENEYIIHIEIEDDGIGIAFEHDKLKGRGLQSMRECAVSLGGKFKINTEQNNGTKITVILPCSTLLQ